MKTTAIDIVYCYFSLAQAGDAPAHSRQLLACFWLIPVSWAFLFP